MVPSSASIKERYRKEIEAFADKLRKAREDRGYTQEELAAKAGISFTTLNRIEQGHVNPSLATIYAITEVLNIPVGDLV